LLRRLRMVSRTIGSVLVVHAAKASKMWKQLWYDAGQNGSSNSTVWEWEEFVRFRIDPGGVFYFLINPPTVKCGFWCEYLRERFPVRGEFVGRSSLKTFR